MSCQPQKEKTKSQIKSRYLATDERVAINCVKNWTKHWRKCHSKPSPESCVHFAHVWSVRWLRYVNFGANRLCLCSYTDQHRLPLPFYHSFQSFDQFEYDGCDNCEEFLRMKNNKDNVYDCTSNNFDGLIAVMSPEDSWVCKWQRISEYWLSPLIVSRVETNLTNCP